MKIYTKKYTFFLSIILKVHNDPCFEDKSSSFTLKCRPVHFPNKAVCIVLLYRLKIVTDPFTNFSQLTSTLKYNNHF